MTVGVTMADMAEACRYEACRIEQLQGALVEAGLRAAPDEGEMARARAFVATVNFLDLCRGDIKIMERLRWLRSASQTRVNALVPSRRPASQQRVAPSNAEARPGP